MAKNKKRKAKKIVIGIMVIILIILLTIMIRRTQKTTYEEELPTLGELTTYYHFSGDIEAKNTQNQLSKKTIIVHDIPVKEGDAVKEGDTIIKTSAGEKIKATTDGEVKKIYVEEDDQVISGSKLFDIIDYHHLQITIKVDEYDLPSITTGKEVEIIINALDKKVKGTISEISKEATSTNGVSYFTAKIELEQDPEIKVGMTAEIKVQNKTVSDVILISMDAIQTDKENKPYVYIKGEKEIATIKYIETGISDGLKVEVKSGLSTSDTVLIPVEKGTSSQMQPRFGSLSGGKNTNEQ